jgi:solute carrier family 35 protein E4
MLRPYCPVSLTCFHLVFQLCSLSPLMFRPPYAGTHEEVVVRNWKGVLAIGLFMGLNIGLNNASLAGGSGEQALHRR